MGESIRAIMVPLWLLVEMIIVAFLDAVDVLTSSNNDVKFVETRKVYFARLKSSSRFITCLPPKKHVTLL